MHIPPNTFDVQYECKDKISLREINTSEGTYSTNNANVHILTDFNYATLTSPYISQKTVKCKLPLLRQCHHELASSANTLVLIAQLNWTTLFAPYEFSHLNIS